MTFLAEWEPVFQAASTLLFGGLCIVMWLVNRTVDRLEKTNRQIREELFALEDAEREATASRLALLRHAMEKADKE
jgi:hypothetical protein